MSKARRRRQYERQVAAELDKAAAEGRLIPGRRYSINVRHDAWCDLLGGRGPCNCTPEVEAPVLVAGAEDN